MGLEFNYNKYSEQEAVLTDGSDALANAGFTIGFKHMPSGKEVYLKAYLKEYQDNFKSNWENETVYGRADGIYMFKNTTRQLTLGITIPAFSEGEAYENLAKVQLLTQFLYPAYVNPYGAETIGQSPLMRLKVMNMLQKNKTGAPDQTTSAKELFNLFKSSGNSPGADNGLLGFISDLSINHHLDDEKIGVMEIGKDNGSNLGSAGTILPKIIDISFGFTPVHETPLGWSKDESGNVNFATPNFPYNAPLEDSLDEITFGDEPYNNVDDIQFQDVPEEQLAQQESTFDATEVFTQKLGGDTTDITSLGIYEGELPDLSGVIYSSTDAFDAPASYLQTIENIPTNSILTDSLTAGIGAGPERIRSGLSAARSTGRLFGAIDRI